MKKILGVFALSLLWSSLLISWVNFADPDGFYHIKMASIIWTSGVPVTFPSLDLTVLGDPFVDLHFLFHAIEAPFVATFGWALGMRAVSVLLASIFLTSSYACLRALKIRWAGAWAVVLAMTQTLLIRLLLGKASPLALTLFLVGLTSAWKRRPFITMLATLLFALSHGGWLFLMGSVCLLAFGEFLHRVIAEDEKFWPAVRASGWREALFSIAGAMIGLVIHPHFPANLKFLWLQVVKIGLSTPFEHVMLGNEWLPTNVMDLISSFAPWLVLLLAGLFALAFAGYQEFKRQHTRAVIAFALPVACLIALTFRSRRNAEYLAPVLALWIPMIWMLVDPLKLRQTLREIFPVHNTKIAIAVGAVLLFSLLNGGASAYRSLHSDYLPDDIYQREMAPISERAKPGDRVFHSDWDEYPILFNLDARLKYIVGLDPTYLYASTSTLSDLYRELTWGSTTPTQEQAWNFIRERTESRFVFIDAREHSKLLSIIEGDPRYTQLIKTEMASAFEIGF